MAKICLGCLNPLPDADETCRICGFNADTKNPDHALPIESALQEHYTIGRLVHEASDSLFYFGYDKALKEPCFIQEYYPNALCERTEGGQLLPLGGCENAYAEYQGQFHALMRSLARAKDLPNVIPVYDIFEENGTCYAVSDYCAGETLAKKIERAGGRIPWQEARPLFMSLISSVEQLENAGVHHLAICPDNILISEDGKPHLRGFSIAATRRVGSDLQPRLATGYAAPEQYEFDRPIGEETDVYGLAATIFATVTGTAAPAGNLRATESDDLLMSAEIAEELSRQVCVALFNALQVNPAERTATVEAFHRQLSLEPNVSALLDEDAPAKEKKGLSKQTRTVLIVFVATLVVLLAVAAILLSLLTGKSGKGKDKGKDKGTTTPPPFTTTTTATTAPPRYTVPNLIGENYHDVLNQKYNGDFKIVNTVQERNEAPAGTILRQTPEKGTITEQKGTVITVIISSGPNDEVEVPDLTYGWTEANAKQLLEALGLKVKIAKIYVSEQDYGYVDRTDPVAGTIVEKGDTVTLYVSYVTGNVEPDNGDVSDSEENSDVSNDDGEGEPAEDFIG